MFPSEVDVCRNTERNKINDALRQEPASTKVVLSCVTGLLVTTCAACLCAFQGNSAGAIQLT